MDFEDIIPFAIVIFYLLSAILTRLGRSKSEDSAGGAVSKNAGVDLLKDLLTGRVSVEEVREREAEKRQSRSRQKKVPAKTKASALGARQPEPLASTQVVTPSAVPKASFTAKKRPGFRRPKLHQAVIWAELLGKPVSLREER